jgi:hypothetical protein
MALYSRYARVANPVGHRIREAVRAGADRGLGIAIIGAILTGKTAHHPLEARLGAELPDQAAGRVGMMPPKPRNRWADAQETAGTAPKIASR